MNKKNIILMATLMISACAPLFANVPEMSKTERQYAKDRCEKLYLLAKTNNINAAQFAEYGVNPITLIDNDIALLEINSAQILSKKNNAIGYIWNSKSSGFWKNAGLALEIMPLPLAIGGFGIWVESIVNSPTAKLTATEKIAIEKMGIRYASGWAAFVLASAVISKLCFNKATSLFVQDMQKQYDRDQVVIAQLKLVKYELMRAA